MTDRADQMVWSRLDKAYNPTERISDTGTVENLLEAGLTIKQIEAGKFTQAQLNDAICWLY